MVEISRSFLRTRATLPAALLSLAAALGLGILSYAEHTRNIRPSSIINAYLLLTLPFDAAQLRTKWLRGDDVAASGVSSSILAVKLLVLISEAIEKRRILVSPYAGPSPEATSGLYSRGVFWWLNSLFRLGFRKVVSEDNLFAVDEDLQSKALAARFDKHWAKRKCTFAPPSLSMTYIHLRQGIPPEAHLSLGYLRHNVRPVHSSHATPPNPHILLIHATAPHQQYHHSGLLSRFSNRKFSRLEPGSRFWTRLRRSCYSRWCLSA